MFAPLVIAFVPYFKHIGIAIKHILLIESKEYA